MRTLIAIALSVLSAVSASAADAKVDAKALFTQKCALCHGTDGKRKTVIQKSNAHDLDDAAWQKATSDADIKKTITDGHPGTMMRAFGKELTPAQIDALVAYIRAFAPKP